ncbi:Transcriptional adapter 2 [Talaromyces islandicus]|uniref:Transcriptional adapter 2 n=1 Tax=Talaromyces islandicus TaxID=28573 RepID=A0A0U1LUB6_TALIS|nr:Transcriptional adapter 2 [Talaromyces islandicus]
MDPPLQTPCRDSLLQGSACRACRYRAYRSNIDDILCRYSLHHSGFKRALCFRTLPSTSDKPPVVRISCAHSACPEYDLCVPCFAAGESSKTHDPRTHPFHVIEQNSVPIYTEDWGADEELLLLEGAEIYGLGSWADIADHIGGYRTKEEVRDHYVETYIDSPNFPLPSRADPEDKTLQDLVSKEEFQTRKKRRIEERKEAAKAAPPATPKQKPTASVPSCHEVQGYMPGRLEFETEFCNEAEEAVQHMQFEPGNGLNANGEMEPEMELKMTVMEIYNSRLTQRTERKKVLFEHNLLEYRKNTAQEKKRTKEEKDLMNKAKPFSRMMNHDDFEEFCKGLEYEHNLRLAIAQLQEWRQYGITDLKSGEKYEQEKQQRAQRAIPTGSFDRLASARPTKQMQQPEGPSQASLLTTPELPLRFQKAAKPAGPDPNVPLNDFDRAFGDVGTPQPAAKSKYIVQPLNGVVPWKLESEGAPDLHLLAKEEIDLCNALHVQPKPYLVIKETLLKESMKQNGSLKKKDARAICKIDVAKAGRIFDFMVHSGWIIKG